MLLRAFFLLITLLPLSTPLHADVWGNIKGYLGFSEKREPPTIRILVLHDVEGTDLQVDGKYSLYDPYANAYLSSRFVGKRKYMQAMSDGLKWGEAFPGLYQLKIQPDETTTTTIVDGKSYAGPVFIYDIGGAISIINQIPVEEYIRSQLAQQKISSLHRETLAALAIVARTNAYFQTANPKNTYWAVDAQKVGYEGNIDPASEIEDAINITRYMVLSNTGVYEGVATPFAAEFGTVTPGPGYKDIKVSKLSIEEANKMAESGEHAAQILSRAFPHTTIMLGY